MHSRAPAVSIIVPVLNEVPSATHDALSSRINGLIALLRPCDELVLVDGGSTDDSWPTLRALAQHGQVKAIQSERGRARQMNAGAALAQGEVLLFVHADTRLPAGAWADFLDCLGQHLGRVVWGRFDVHIEGKSRWLPVVAWLMNWRSRLSKIGTGDQALFVTRDLFLDMKGFPDQPLMEDIELCKRLKKRLPNNFLAIATPVETSGRRWDNHGVWKTIVLMWRFRYQYWRGVSASELARQYRDARDKIPLTVAVFAKYPQAGRVKTRLEPLLGPSQCEQFARYLLLSTLDKLRGVNVTLWTDGGTPQQWDALLAGRVVTREVQPQGHLGLRMQAAVDAALTHSEMVVLLGPDAIQFSMKDLQLLRTEAAKSGLALVPAHDGGYVALACTRCVPQIFTEQIDWGTEKVAAQTQSILVSLGIKAQWLNAQLDIDEPEDLHAAISQGDLAANWATRYKDN